MELGWAALVGAIVGSFLNVCIRRIPEGLSIVRPRSHCPTCGTPLRLRDNVPILSFVLLRGRCAHCRAPISWQYPLVEVLTAVLFVAVIIRFGVSFDALIAAGFVAALVVVTFIDFEHQIIPDVISLPGIVIGLAATALGWGPGLSDSLLGVLIGGGFLWFIAWGYESLAGREGMGGGDIKLLAMIGAFLGWQSVVLVILVSSVGGSIAGVAAIIARGGDTKVPIPFGPFLAFGALVALFGGDWIVSWYLTRMGL